MTVLLETAPSRPRCCQRPTADAVTSEEICLLTGATFRQVDHWDTVGLLTPLTQCRGSGHTRWWHFDDAPVLAAVVRLRALGIGLEQCFDLARRGPGTRSMGPGIALVLTLTLWETRA